MSADAKSLYQSSLSAQHAEEKQGLRMIEAQLSSLDDYPEYRAVLEKHVATTGEQIARIERALEDTGSSPATFKEAVTQAVGVAGAAVHGLFPDTQVKNLFAGYAYQYHQAAAYEALAVFAEAAGYSQHLEWIGQSQKEEEQAARAVHKLIVPVTQRYLELTTAK